MTPRQRSALIGAVLLTAALLVGASLAQRGMGGTAGTGYGATGHGGTDYGDAGMGPGQMGGYGRAGGYGMMGQGYGGQGIRTVDWNAARAMIASGLQGATIDPTTNTVSYTGASVTLDVIAVQPDEPDTTFEIAGLVDPTVTIPRGATVTLDLVNMDYGADMPHGLVLTRFAPPYPYMAPMMGGGLRSGIPPLSARTDENLQSASYTSGTLRFRAATPGTYYYVCQVPGHAQKGMYGKIVVE